jgi:hypothetical protein
MASNQVPVNRDQLFASAQDLVDGLKAQEARLDIQQNTEKKMRSALEAALNANISLNVLSAANASLIAALNDAAGTARKFVQSAKFVLANSLGRRWSAAWLPAGFTGGSLNVPREIPEQLTLLEALQKYLEANPDKQVQALNVTADKQVQALTVTASQAGVVLEALKNAKAAVVAGNSAVGAAQKERIQKEKELRWRFTALIAELTLLLDDDDPTWYAFGLRRPSDPESPSAPSDVSVTAGLPGTIFVSWTAAKRAERYKVYKKEEGDAEFQTAATTPILEALITGLKGGSPIEIQVSALNIGGESLPSSPVQIVVPPENLGEVQA